MTCQGSTDPGSRSLVQSLTPRDPLGASKWQSLSMLGTKGNDSVREMMARYVKYRKVLCHTVSNFPGCRVPFIRKLTVSGKISPTKDSRRGLWAAKGLLHVCRRLKVAHTAGTQTFGLYALLLKNPRLCHDFATNLALLGRI